MVRFLSLGLVLVLFLLIHVSTQNDVDSMYCFEEVDNSLFPQETYYLPITNSDVSENCSVGEDRLVLKSVKIPKGNSFISVVAIFPWMKNTNEGGGKNENCQLNKFTLDIYFKEGSVPDPTKDDHDKHFENVRYYEWKGVKLKSENGSNFYTLIRYHSDDNKNCSTVFWASSFYFTTGIYAYTVGILIGLLLLLCCFICCGTILILLLLSLPLIIILIIFGGVGGAIASLMAFCGVCGFCCCCCAKKSLDVSGNPSDLGDGIEGEPLLKDKSGINNGQTQGIAILRYGRGEPGYQQPVASGFASMTKDDFVV